MATRGGLSETRLLLGRCDAQLECDGKLEGWTWGGFEVVFLGFLVCGAFWELSLFRWCLAIGSMDLAWVNISALRQCVIRPSVHRSVACMNDGQISMRIKQL